MTNKEGNKPVPEKPQTGTTGHDVRIRSLISNLNDPIMLRQTEKILRENGESFKGKEKPEEE